MLNKVYKIKLLYQCAVLIIVFLLTGCKTTDFYETHDPHLKLSEKEYEAALFPDAPAPKKFRTKPLSVSKPPFPPGFRKKISLSFTTEAPVKDILITLAQQVGISMAVSPDIRSSLSFHAQNRPCFEVIQQICALAKLRYTLEGDFVRIEPDTPYLKTYPLQFLSLTRENSNRTSIATDVFSVIDGKKNELDNGSNTLLTGTTKTDFWEDLEKNIRLILGDERENQFSLHAQAGLISIKATEEEHRRIKKYFRMLSLAASSQVLIEAKIVEVHLKDEFKSGINWNSLKGDFSLQAPLGQIAVPGPFNPSATPQRNVFSVGGRGHHLSGLLSLIKNFGTVRTLSSPRLTVMNNQSAVIKVATNKVFFRIDYDRESSFENNARERERVSSEIQTIPIGLVMVVQPSINSETGEIIMTLRPTISRVVDEKEDPAVAIVSKQEQISLIPEIQVRELDSVLTMSSGEVAIMGGLMEERSDNDQTGVPELSDIPLLGGLFRGQSKDRSVTELVIFIRATILDPQTGENYKVQSTPVSSADQDVYQTFTKDPRPLSF